MEEVTLQESLAELLPFVGREVGVVVLVSESREQVLTSFGTLTAVQGDESSALVLLGPEGGGSRIALKQSQLRRIQVLPGKGSVIYSLDGILMIVGVQPDAEHPVWMDA